MAKMTTRTGKSTRKAAHIPRPLNAFILFRTHIAAKEKAERSQVMQAYPVRPKMTPAESKAKFGMESKRISLLYRALSDAEKEEWVQKAKIVDAEHKKMHPNYIYTPGPAKKGRRKAAPRPDDDEGRTPLPLPKAVQVNEPSSTAEQRDCGPVRRKKSTRTAPYPSPQRGKKSKTPSQSPPPLSSPSSGSSSSGSSPPLPSPVSEHSQLLNPYDSLSFKGSSDTDQLAAVPHSGVAGPAYSTSFHTTGSGSADVVSLDGWWVGAAFNDPFDQSAHSDIGNTTFQPGDYIEQQVGLDNWAVGSSEGTEYHPNFPFYDIPDPNLYHGHHF